MPTATGLGFVVVAAAGTPQQLSSVALLAASVRLYPRASVASANVGKIYIGTQAMVKATGVGVYAMLDPETIEGIQLPVNVDIRQIYIDADNNGDGVQVGYIAH